MPVEKSEGAKIFGDAFEKDALQSTQRREFHRHPMPKQERHKPDLLGSSWFTDADTKNDLSSVVMRPKCIVDPQLKPAMDAVRHESLRGHKHVAAPSQVDCSIIGSKFDATSEYQSLSKCIRGPRRDDPPLPRSSFEPQRNPITQKLLTQQPYSFDRPKAAGAYMGHTSRDAEVRSHQRTRPK